MDFVASEGLKCSGWIKGKGITHGYRKGMGKDTETG